jgi:Ni,Fe-hydrogenase I large subunit
MFVSFNNTLSNLYITLEYLGKVAVKDGLVKAVAYFKEEYEHVFGETEQTMTVRFEYDRSAAPGMTAVLKNSKQAVRQLTILSSFLGG